ncbi:succinate dehydrogenase cytochrome b subunit [Persicobacter psychrovividus]|uniref:Succinate dehydrogenase n=1 Tax=Persicobacter psychrovividus TaxID=387638 RepID=A0ABM7VC98_9BACT|nr:succinate dehydrogenase [Persicobacter psychrovividus]
MSWVKQTLGSTIGRKFLVSLTGLLLISFLLVHCIINSFALISPELYNDAGNFMGSNPFISVVAKVLFAGILVHVIVSAALTVFNRKARGGNAYAVTGNNKKVKWASKNMGLLGSVLLLFIVGHLAHFWVRIQFTELPGEFMLADGHHNLYAMLREGYSHAWIVALYVISMIPLAYHLNHGFQSAFQTLGLNHKNYTPAINAVGAAFSIVIPLLFAAVPLAFFFGVIS